MPETLDYHRSLGLPTTIGLMVIALLFSLALNAASLFLPAVEHKAESIIGSIDFNKALMLPPGDAAGEPGRREVGATVHCPMAACG